MGGFYPHGTTHHQFQPVGGEFSGQDLDGVWQARGFCDNATERAVYFVCGSTEESQTAVAVRRGVVVCPKLVCPVVQGTGVSRRRGAEAGKQR